MFDPFYGLGMAPVTRQLPLFAFGSTVPPVIQSAMPPLPQPNIGIEGMMPGPVTASGLLAAVAVQRGQPQGPTNDQEVEDFLYDALEMLSGANDVEVRCEGGRVTLTGTVQHKRLKHDAGEIAWTIPVLQDVQNTITIASRRRSRASTREAEGQTPAQGRKPGERTAA